MIIRQVVSGGQTGVDRAALDVALRLKIPCGGWCPKERLAEDGPLDKRYPLKETPSAEYAERTMWNVRDSDGTLILTLGPPTNGTAFTLACAESLGKPRFVVDFQEAADTLPVGEWIESNGLNILNIAGPRASKCPAIYDETARFLSRLFGSDG